MTQAHLVAGIEAHRTRLVAHARPDNPLYQAYLQTPYALDQAEGVARLDAMINRQAAMLAYVGDFQLILILVTACIPLIFLMRSPKGRTSEAAHAMD